jgi:hypothetical protein
LVAPLLEPVEQALDPGQHRAAAVDELDHALLEGLAANHGQVDLQAHSYAGADLHAPTVHERAGGGSRPADNATPAPRSIVNAG